MYSLMGMDEFLIKVVSAHPEGCTTQYLSVASFSYFSWYYRRNYDGWPQLKKDLGRLLIEKKIDYSREGLWVPINGTSK